MYYSFVKLFNFLIELEYLKTNIPLSVQQTCLSLFGNTVKTRVYCRPTVPSV